MQKYRAKKGRYRTKSDFRRLYGVTDSMYQALEPFLLLPDTLPRRDSVRTDTLRRDTSRTYYVHEKRDTIIELNSADTSSLQYIRGIGKYTAVQIVRYRQRLGGFVSVEQLREIEGLDYVKWDSVMPHLWADREQIERLKINTASVERLQRHPYMSFEQAKAVYTLRRKRIRLHNIEELRGLPFTEEQLTRLAPYLDFGSEQR
jgi:DNA uptake protein ComE-like DNA-binding protein